MKQHTTQASRNAAFESPRKASEPPKRNVLKNNETKPKKPRRQWLRPSMVECVVPDDWNDTLDKQYASDAIGEPAEGHTWHEHCMEHIARQMADLHQGLDCVIRHLAPPVSENGALLETMKASAKVSAVRKLVALHAAQMLAEQQARMMAGSPILIIGGFLTQAEDALDVCECAEALQSRVLIHHALYGEDVWLVELTRAGDWIGTALADLADALPIEVMGK